MIAFRYTPKASVSIVMSSPDLSPGGSLPRATLALENALLRIGPASTAILHAVYAGTRLEGSLEFVFENVQIVPTLADPYASSNPLLMPITATVTALATWTVQSGVILSFGIVSSTTAALDNYVVTMLDLSGNSDQFGVSVEALPDGRNILELDGMSLTAPQKFLAVYTLPGISWEPVVDQSTGDWLNAASSDDGPPILLRANTGTLVHSGTARDSSRLRASRRRRRQLRAVHVALWSDGDTRGSRQRTGADTVLCVCKLVVCEWSERGALALDSGAVGDQGRRPGVARHDDDRVAGPDTNGWQHRLWSADTRQ